MSDFSASKDKSETGLGNLPELTVSELSQALKRVVESRFEHVRVRGEISGFKRAASGHLYMALKDENAVLDAVCWRGMAGRLAVRPEDGLEVIAVGRLTTYPGRSKYQIVIESLELAGEGALLKLLEERRRKLAGEGLFDEERKRPLPFLPEVIGVVTSPTGAVIRDILHRLADRFPRRVLVWPVRVQGEGADRLVAEAIKGFNGLAPDGPVPRPDLLIVARGGGSLEDLWSFNEEIVVRAAAASTIPLISAVGHETDTTLIDFAADRRAPTPTAAAEMAVPVRAELITTVLDLERRGVAGLLRLTEDRRVRLEGLARGLPDLNRLVEERGQRLDDRGERLIVGIANRLQRERAQLAETAARLVHPRQQIRLAGQRLATEVGRLERAGVRVLERRDEAFQRLDSGRRIASAVRRRLTDVRSELGALARVLESTSYRNVLNRGFAVVRGAEGLITRAAEAQAGSQVAIEFADGSIGAQLGGDKSAPAETKAAKKSASRKRSSGRDEDPQGSLL